MARTAIVIAVLIATAGGPLAEGDVALGKQVFEEKCAGCHSVGKDAKAGPPLKDLIGRQAASIQGFDYSPAMSEAGHSGMVWNIETLSKFISQPNSLVNGTRMPFMGLPNLDDVANVVAYLATLSPPRKQ